MSRLRLAGPYCGDPQSRENPPQVFRFRLVLPCLRF
jgi:hypothetical protein